MRKLIYAINLTLDGCCEHTKVGPPEEEVFDYYIRLVREADLFVYGRKTYQLMVPYWPDLAKNTSPKTKADKADVEFGQAFDSKNRIVFSRSLESADEKSRIVRTNLKDEILKLKQEPGNYILTGGVSIPEQLIELGLVDELRILIVPVLAGKGRRLFEGVNLQEKLRLKLVESKTYKLGSVLLHYSKS
jgi:dihydrofolate reductase